MKDRQGQGFRKVPSPGGSASLRPVHHAKTTPGPDKKSMDSNSKDPLQKWDPWTNASARTSPAGIGRRTQSAPPARNANVPSETHRGNEAIPSHPTSRPEGRSPVVQFQIDTPPHTPIRSESSRIYVHKPVAERLESETNLRRHHGLERAPELSAASLQRAKDAIQLLFGERSISVPLLLEALLGLSCPSVDEALHSQPKAGGAATPAGGPEQLVQKDDLGPNQQEDGGPRTSYTGQRWAKPDSPELLPHHPPHSLRMPAHPRIAMGTTQASTGVTDADSLAGQQDDFRGVDSKPPQGGQGQPVGKTSQGVHPQKDDLMTDQFDSCSVTPTRGTPSSPAIQWLDSNPGTPSCSGSEPLPLAPIL